MLNRITRVLLVNKTSMGSSCSAQNNAKQDIDPDEEKASLLLLGFSNSGKTTMLKQMQIINMAGFEKLLK